MEAEMDAAPGVARVFCGRIAALAAVRRGGASLGLFEHLHELPRHADVALRRQQQQEKAREELRASLVRSPRSRPNLMERGSLSKR